MEEVLKTISELKFRSIALIAALILLALATIWWLLGGSSTPPRIRTSQQASAVNPIAHIGTQSAGNQLSTPSEQQASGTENPELLIVNGQLQLPSVATETEADTVTNKSAGKFTIQVGAFKREAGALELQSELQSKGYESRVVQTPGEDGMTYRLVAGIYLTRDSASRVATQLKAEGIDAFVRARDVDQNSVLSEASVTP